VLNTVSDAVTVIDKDLKILFQNEAVQQIYGSSLGGKCYEAYRGRREPCENCIILEVIKDGKPKRALRDIQLPDGNILWMEVFSGPFKDKAGKTIGAVEVVRNVTEQIRLSEECVTLRREMERQAQIYNICHSVQEDESESLAYQKGGFDHGSSLITGNPTGKELIAGHCF
jgi:PAS domain S-box-containing protein